MLLGFYGGFGLNSLTGNLSSTELPGSIPGSGECGSFQEGTGTGVHGGLLFESRLSPIVSLGARLEYSDRSGEMTYRCVDPAQARLPDGSLATAETEHIAEISLGTLTLHLIAAARPFDFPLVLSLGPSISYGLGGDYNLTEKIVTPQSAEFVTGGQVREYGSGSLAPNGGLINAGFFGGLGYELPAGDDWRLRPEVSFHVPIGDDLTLGVIRSKSLRFSLALIRLFKEEPTEIVQQPIAVEPEPVLPDVDPSQATLQANNGTGWTDGPLVIRRFIPIRTRLIPLLPYIFYDNRSDDLPARYARIDAGSTEAFNENDFASQSNLGVYAHALNIVGSRLRRYPDAQLTLTGMAPDAPEGAATTALAQARAEAIRDYLNDVWGIAEDRMNIVPRRDPEVPTNPETPDGRAENRRVELSSNRFEVLAPLTFTDTWGATDEGHARVLVDGTTDVDATGWSIDYGNARERERLSGTGSLVDELALDEILSSFSDVDSLTVDLTFTRKDSGKEVHHLAIPVRRDETYARRIASGEYSLIIFDAANAELRNEHRQIIDSIVALLPEDATISIYGYTDYLGDSTENQRLSERRAAQVAERFGTRKAQIERVQGLGEDTETFHVLGLPEERMYARRVVIEVKRKSVE